MGLPKRKAIRLKGYDYSRNGAYFITVCTQNRAKILSEVDKIAEISVGQGLCSCRSNDFCRSAPARRCRLSTIGKITEIEIQSIPIHYPGVRVDKYVIMPNHFHLILMIERPALGERQEQSPCPTAGESIFENSKTICETRDILHTVGDVLCAVKSLSTKKANKIDDTEGRKIWQYRFFDHIIRNEQEYQKIWRYIDENPLKWEKDCFFCDS